MKGKTANICFACHAEVENASIADYQHAILQNNLECQACHKPHSSHEEKLLRQNENTLCGQCHKHSFSHPTVKKANGTPVINPMTCKAMVCSSCHAVHGSKFSALTVAEKNRDLCLLCHPKTEH